jgi:hypothetical protein
MNKNEEAMRNVRYFPQSKTMSVEIFYPRSGGEPAAVEVALSDVRAAQDILIEFDFHRDGWSIKGLVNTNDWESGWIERAFVPAWSPEDLARFEE